MTLVIPLALVAVSVCMLLLFSAQTARRTRELTYTILKAVGAEQRDLLNVKIEGDFSTLSALAGVAASSDETHYEQLLGHMRAALVSSGFACFFVADASGCGVTGEGETAYIGDRAYFQEAFAGGRTLERVYDCRFGTETSAFILAVPVGNAGSVTGTVVGVLDESEIDELLTRRSYNGSESFICSAEGEIVTGGEIAAAPERYGGMSGVFENAEFEDEFGAQSASADLQSGTEGFISYKIDGERWYLAYMPLGTNGWMICTAIPGDAVDDTLRAERADTYLIIGVAMASALLLILLVVSFYARLGRQSRREQEQLRVAEEEYRLSAQQSGAMIVRYDLEADLLMPNETAAEMFRRKEGGTNFDYTFAPETLVEEESKTDYQAFWSAIRAGEPSGSANVRMKNASGELRWYAFSFTAIRGASGRTVQAIVTIRDVTVQREKLIEYESWRRMVSALTGTSAAYIEFRLDAGTVERIEGEFAQDGEKNAETLLRAFEQLRVDPADRRRFRTFVSMERLRRMKKEGTLRDETTVRALQADGSVRECTVSLRILDAEDGEDARAIVAVTDFGDSRRGMERLSKLAFRDELSGLLNRAAARAAIGEALRTGGSETVALFMLDIDNFKLVNDLMGHRQGDRALVRISEALCKVFRTTDVIARIGGDEFFAFLTDASAPGLVEAKAAALREALDFTYSDGIRSVAISASVGIVVAQRDKVDYDELYAKADLALYEAKNNGKNRYRIRYAEGEAVTCAGAQDDGHYSTQIHSLLKYADGGVALLEAGDTVRLIFESGGGVRRDGGPVWNEKDVHPEDREALLSKMRACAQDGTAFEATYRFLTADGVCGWRHVRAERIPYGRRKCPVLIAVITDITGLKRSALGLETAADTPVGIAIARFGERIEVSFYNDALLRILGVTFEQYSLIAHDCSALLLGEDLTAMRAAAEESAESGEPMESSFDIVGKDGLFARRITARGVLIDMLNGVPSFLLVFTEWREKEG